MKIIEPHIDLASIYDEFNLDINDFLSKEDTDVPVSLSKLVKSEIDIAGFTLFVDPTNRTGSIYDWVKRYYEFYRLLLSKTKKLVQIYNYQEILNKSKDKIAFFFSIEGLDCIRNIDDFEEFYELGVRSFGLTWLDNKFATSRHSNLDKGISKEGIELLKNMNSKRLIIDIAHLSKKSIKDLDNNFDGMIVTTHGNSKSVYNSPFNLSDEEIQMIVEREGIVSLFLLSEDVGKTGSFEELYKHLEYIASKWGIDYVGFSADIFPLEEYPFINNAKDITIMKDLQAFLKSKMANEDLEKVLYKNWMRVLKKSL